MSEFYKDSGIKTETFDADRHSSRDIALIHLAIRQWQEKVGQNTYSNIKASQEDLGDIPKHYLDGGQFFVATNQEGEIVGFVGLKRTPRTRSLVLKRLAVILEYRGHGIASQLVGECVRWAEESGCDRIGLATGAQEKAKSIYQRHGFKIIGRNERNADFIMELDLHSNSAS